MAADLHETTLVGRRCSTTHLARLMARATHPRPPYPWCSLAGTGAITLFQAVAKNRSLLTLRCVPHSPLACLPHSRPLCRIADRSLSAQASKADTYTSSSCSLEGNSLSPFAVGAFEHSLKQNHVLQHLHLDNNALQPSDLAALDLHVAVNRDLLAITADPMLYNVEIRSAEFQEQLLRKLHHLRKEDHQRLRDFNRSMRMDRRFHELLVTLVPYTRKEMLHMLELKKVRGSWTLPWSAPMSVTHGCYPGCW